jgi:hypothetical protein
MDKVKYGRDSTAGVITLISFHYIHNLLNCYIEYNIIKLVL